MDPAGSNPLKEQVDACSVLRLGWEEVWERLIYCLIESSYKAFIFIGQSLPPFQDSNTNPILNKLLNRANPLSLTELTKLRILTNY
jgi:hypothetical protein